jgi:hypothetical protein
MNISKKQRSMHPPTFFREDEAVRLFSNQYQRRRDGCIIPPKKKRLLHPLLISSEGEAASYSNNYMSESFFVLQQ